MNTAALDALVRSDYGGDPVARELLIASADTSLSKEERTEANERLVEMERERIRRQRGERPIDADAWEGSRLKAVDTGERDRKRSGLKLQSLASLAAVTEATVLWLLAGIVPAGGALVLISAFMKCGKSTFVAALVSAIVRGVQFLGLPVMQGPVLLLAVEELGRDVVIRARACGVRDGDPLQVHVGPLPDTLETWKALRAAIDTIRPALIVVDTLNRFWSVRDENDNAMVNREAGKWLELARETGVTVLLVVHAGKGEGEHGRSIRGASALFALADQALLLTRRKGGTSSQRSLEILGRYPDSPDALVLDYDGTAWSVVGTPEDAEMASGAAKLAECITDEPRTMRELAEDSGIGERMVRKLLPKIPGLVVEGAGRKGDPRTVRRAS